MLTGEERPRSMLGLLALLVLLLHVWALTWLLRPIEPLTAAQPLLMEVSLLAAPAQQTVAAPPAPPPVKKPPLLKQPRPKPPPKKKPPVVQKPPDLPQPETAAPVKPAAQPESDATARETGQAPAAALQAKAPAQQAEKFTEANYRANYGFNPKPEYPRIARSRGWQGKVLLKVQVSAEGYSYAVAIQQSSGHETLDEAAVDAVKKWKFIPAKRGETPVASSVLVPIIFKLDN
jgi:protein TonB